MTSKKDKTGDIAYNNFGSKMVIVGYRKYSDVDIYFPEYNWTAYNRQYTDFKKGRVKCPYEKRYFDIGYLGEGEYSVCEGKKKTQVFNIWLSMLTRCYYDNYNGTHNYKEKGVYVCKEWHNFQNFAQWYEENYYEIEGEKMHLDKDVICKGNKIYSPDKCIFVPQGINELFVKGEKMRGEYPIGVSYHKRDNVFQANCNNHGRSVYLGHFNTVDQAYNCYKNYKENLIKQMADEYKEYIPKKLYNAMYEYKVEITD